MLQVCHHGAVFVIEAKAKRFTGLHGSVSLTLFAFISLFSQKKKKSAEITLRTQ